MGSGSLTAEYVPTEEGLHDISIMSGIVFVPGTDPTDSGPGHQWDYGNLYYKSSGTWTKRRTIPNTLHTLGLYYDGTNLWAACACHAGDYSTWKAYVYKSTDLGATWGSPVEIGTGNYRVYDITAHGGRLYAAVRSLSGLGRLYYSTDNGASWTLVSSVSLDYNARLVNWGSNLIVLASGRNGIYKVDSSHNVIYQALGFTVRSSAKFNAIVAASDGKLYIIGSESVTGCPVPIYGSSNLSSWSCLGNIMYPVSLADDSANSRLTVGCQYGDIWTLAY